MGVLINSIDTKGPQNLTILQYLKFNGYDVPRFCFHEKLDIAGNCRMCLVEIEGVLKPIASCTVKVTDNLSIFTNSVMVRKARQSVLEALLLSHPLDCPICDQGGECDLQDQTLLYGPDRGRFFQRKKSVYDFNLGPFVKTTMTRCINCTRCVRFVSVFGQSFNKDVSSLGHVGRGSEVYIGQYLSRMFLNNDLSGNLIDLCPVGALTSKSYSFTARPWESINFESFDIFDTLLQPIRVDVRDNKILRILPIVDLTPSFFFNEWITDVSRFSFDGYSNKRLEYPMKVDYRSNIFYVWRVSWDFIFSNIVSYNSSFNSNLKLIFGDFLDLQCLVTFSLLNKFYKTFLGNSLDMTLSNNGSFYDFPSLDFRQEFLCGDLLSFSNIDFNSFFFSLGVDLRLDMPIYNLILRQRLKMNYDTNIVAIGSKSLSTNNVFSNNFKDFINLIEGKSYICSFIKSARSNFLLYGNSVYQRFDSFSFSNLFKSIKSFFPIHFYNVKCTTFLNVFDLGLHSSLYKPTFNNKKGTNDFFYYYFNQTSSNSLIYNDYVQTRSVSIFQGTHWFAQSFDLAKYDFLLPSLGFFEKSSFFLNNTGQIKKSSSLISSEFLEQKEDWSIILLMFKLFFGFDLLYNYDDIVQYLFYYVPCNAITATTFFSFNDIMFLKECNIFNVPFISPIDDLIYTSNSICKSSLLMHLSYEAYYNEQRSIFF